VLILLNRRAFFLAKVCDVKNKFVDEKERMCCFHVGALISIDQL